MSSIGIDVSEHNGALDWSKIKAAGIKFAIIRTGYGVSHTDNYWKANITGATAQGIPVGVYHFSYALNTEGAKKEAAFVLSLLEPYKDKITLPVFFDFEYDTISYAQKQGVTLGKQAFNDHTVAFCEAIKAAGYKPGTYYNLDYKNRYVDPSRLGGYVQWYAQYASKASWTGYDIWQYSSSYTISGVSGKFDANILGDESLLTATTTTTETTSVNYTGTVTVNTALNCRSTPSTSGSIIKTYKNGDKVTITKECSGWGYTGEGWVSLDYITKDTTTTTTTTTTTNKYTVGWHSDSKGKWYADTETTYYKSQWAKIDNKWYQFNAEGYMMANTWTTANSEYYYLGEDGTATTNYLVGLDSEGRLRPIEPYYHLISELPDYYRTECDKLVEAGKLKGKEGKGDNLVLDLPLSAIRTMIIDSRA